MAMSGATKSSAGDKHNTERAQLQLQAEKLGQQYKALDAEASRLARIEHYSHTGKAHLGSLVVTDKNNYFLAVAAGRILINEKEFWCIPPNSPIGAMLMGKSVAESISWNKTEQQILEII